MEKIIDCRGLNCPIPVVNTKKYFDSIEEGSAVTIVDNEVAKNNVVKLANKNNLQVSVEEKEDNYYLNITKQGEGNNANKADNTVKQDSSKKEKSSDEKFVLAIGQDKLGKGNDELGDILMKGYIFALSEADIIPTDILMFNSAVKLAINGSPVLESLKKLAERNVNIQVCGTCLSFFNLEDQVAIGEVSNMYSIVETMNEADKVINL